MFTHLPQPHSSYVCYQPYSFYVYLVSCSDRASAFVGVLLLVYGSYLGFTSDSGHIAAELHDVDSHRLCRLRVCRCCAMHCCNCVGTDLSASVRQILRWLRVQWKLLSCTCADSSLRYAARAAYST